MASGKELLAAELIANRDKVRIRDSDGDHFASVKLYGFHVSSVTAAIKRHEPLLA